MVRTLPPFDSAKVCRLNRVPYDEHARCGECDILVGSAYHERQLVQGLCHWCDLDDCQRDEVIQSGVILLSEPEATDFVEALRAALGDAP